MEQIYKNIKVGRPRAFNNPEEMWDSAKEYFQWCEDNKLQEMKVFNNQGEIISAKIPHMRAMTQAGLCVYLNIGVSTWHDYKEKEEYSEVTSIIESIMYEQKFSGAASGMFNSNIIARDLGLSEKTDNTSTHKIIKADEEEW